MLWYAWENAKGRIDIGMVDEVGEPIEESAEKNPDVIFFEAELGTVGVPEIRQYKVTQTREVEIAANSHRDAIEIAHAAFENGQDANYRVIDGPQDVRGSTVTKVKTIEVNCRRTD